MKFTVGENGRNPVKNLARPRFVHHETHMEGPRRELGIQAVGGERLTACATRPSINTINTIYTIINIITTIIPTIITIIITIIILHHTQCHLDVGIPSL